MFMEFNKIFRVDVNIPKLTKTKSEVITVDNSFDNAFVRRL